MWAIALSVLTFEENLFTDGHFSSVMAGVLRQWVARRGRAAAAPALVPEQRMINLLMPEQRMVTWLMLDWFLEQPRNVVVVGGCGVVGSSVVRELEETTDCRVVVVDNVAGADVRCDAIDSTDRASFVLEQATHAFDHKHLDVLITMAEAETTDPYFLMDAARTSLKYAGRVVNVSPIQPHTTASTVALSKATRRAAAEVSWLRFNHIAPYITAPIQGPVDLSELTSLICRYATDPAVESITGTTIAVKVNK